MPLRPAVCTAAALLLLAAALPGASADISVCKEAPPGAAIDGPNITVWGQQTLIAFGSGFRPSQGALPGVEGPWLAPIITGIVLFIEGGFLAGIAPKGAPLLYYLFALYPVATGLVEFARVNFDASRFGFLTATWHNLPEYGILAHLFLCHKGARKLFPFILLWVWALDVFILFVPSLDGKRIGPFFGGLIEQLTGICCDHLLMYTFTYLWYTTDAMEKPALKRAYMFGGLGAFMHMLEIGPLVILLTGLVPRPYIPICVLVAFTTPITFYLYGLMAKEWVGDAAKDAEAKAPIAPKPRKLLLALGIGLGLTNILAPVLLIPDCPPAPLAPLPVAPAGAPPAYASYVQNTFTQGTTLFNRRGAGLVTVSSLPVLADMDWQILQAKVEPGYAVVPLYSDAPILVYVVTGRMSVLLTESSGIPLGVQKLGPGEVLAVKRGQVFGIDSMGDTTLQIVAFINTAPTVGRFRGSQTLFPLFGAQGPLASLTPDVLQTALNTTASVVAELRAKYGSQPFVFKPSASPRYTSAAPAIPGYTWNMDVELDKFGLKTPGAGGVTVGNHTVDAWGILSDLGFTPVWAYISKGSLLAAHTHVGSVEIDVITKGEALVQLVSPDGTLLTNQVVRPGDVFVIPPGFSHIHKTPCSDAGEHAFIAIQSDLRFHTFFTTGAFGILRPFVLPADAAALSTQSQIGFAQDYECHGASAVPRTEL